MSTEAETKGTANPTNAEESAQFRGAIRVDWLRELLGTVGSIATEAKFTVGPDGEIALKVVDPSHVAIMTYEAPSEVWESITVTQPGDMVLDLKRVAVVLRGIKQKGAIVGLAIKGETLEIASDMGTQEMHLSDPAGIAVPKVPNVTPPISLVASLADLKESLRQSSRVSDHVALVTYPGSPCQLWVKTTGEKDKIRSRVPVVESDWGKTEGDRVASLYPLDFFGAMVRALPKSAQWGGYDGYVKMAYGNAYPLRIDFTLAAGLTKACYLLAPRIEEESGGSSDPDGHKWVPPATPTGTAPAPAPKPRKARKTAAVPAAAPPAPVVAVATAPAAVVPLPPAPAPEIRDDVPTAPRSTGVQIEPTITVERCLAVIGALIDWEKGMGGWDAPIWREAEKLIGATDPRKHKRGEPEEKHVIGAW